MEQPVLYTFTLEGADETRELALAMEPVLGAGDTVLLKGPVGAGKTHYARCVIQQKLSLTDQNEDVPSPTFTLVQTYQAGALEIWHADLYRLSSADELIELGLDEALPQALCFIEWPDLLINEMTADALSITLSNHQNGNSRIAVLSGDKAWAARLAAVFDSMAAEHE